MKKIVLLSGMLCLFIGCSQDTLIDESTASGFDGLQNQYHKDSKIFHFKDWKAVGKAYDDFLHLDNSELENVSFYSEDKELNASKAIKAILNNDNQFMVADSLIQFKKGKFYNLFFSSDLKYAKIVGSLSNNILQKQVDETLKTNVGLDEIHSVQFEFDKQRYVEDCGSGKVQGSSPRAFKFVNEVVSEIFTYPASMYSYSLYLRIKLEYNSFGNHWRHSGELREISIDITDKSKLMIGYGPGVFPDQSGHSATENYDIYYTCHSNVEIPLRNYQQGGPIQQYSHYEADVKGTIIQKMVGDVEANRWTHNANW